MTRTEQKAKGKMEQFIADNDAFFTPFKKEYQNTKQAITITFGSTIPKFRLAQWVDTQDAKFKEELIQLGGRMTAMRKSFPVKFTNHLLKHLEMDSSLVKLAEHCYYFFQYQEIFTNGKGKDLAERFTSNLTKWQQGKLDTDAKDRFFSICSELRQSIPTKHLKSYGKYLFGASYHNIQIIMLDCYRNPEVLEGGNSVFVLKTK
ncbi:MAG: hypothetical protein ACPG44_04275 [Polaribacter sp.]